MAEYSGVVDFVGLCMTLREFLYHSARLAFGSLWMLLEIVANCGSVSLVQDLYKVDAPPLTFTLYDGQGIAQPILSGSPINNEGIRDLHPTHGAGQIRPRTRRTVDLR